MGRSSMRPSLIQRVLLRMSPHHSDPERAAHNAETTDALQDAAKTMRSVADGFPLAPNDPLVAEYRQLDKKLKASRS